MERLTINVTESKYRPATVTSWSLVSCKDRMDWIQFVQVYNDLMDTLYPH